VSYNVRLSSELPYSWYESEMNIFILLNKSNMKYHRKVYTFFDCVGDAGGLFEAIMVISGLIVSPFYFNI
jgi:hypothetical protein